MGVERNLKVANQAVTFAMPIILGGVYCLNVLNKNIDICEPLRENRPFAINY